MAKFEIVRSKRTVSGRGPSVRADIDVRTGAGEVARAIRGVGEAIAGFAIQIKQKRQRMLDTRSAVAANSLITTAIDENIAFRNINADTTTWSKDLQERLSKAETQITTLDMSDNARLLVNTKFQARLQEAMANSLIAETRQEKEDTRAAIINDVTEAYSSGTEQGQKDAGRRFLEIAPMFMDDNEIRATLKAAIMAGQKARQKEILNEWQRRVAENPSETAAVLNIELKARGRGEGVIPEEVLPSETIQSLLNTATNRQSQLVAKSNEEYNNRKGEETERLSKLLVDGELIEQEIDEIDLQAFGAQKEDEFKWKQNWKKILRNTIKLTEPIISSEATYDTLARDSEAVERGAKSPAGWEQEFATAWANGELTKEDRRDLRSKDIVATRTMQNRAFAEMGANTRPRLVELRDDELAGLVAARDSALKIKDLKSVNILNFSIKKAQIQKWNFGRWRTELRSQISQNENWSQKQIFTAADILAEQFDKDIDVLMLEFENANPKESILRTPPSDELKDIWPDLSQEDKAKVWELRLLGASIREITREL